MNEPALNNIVLIIIAVIQAISVVLASRTRNIASVILKDVNSDRTARIAEVKELNEKLRIVEKLNAILEEQRTSGRTKDISP